MRKNQPEMPQHRLVSFVRTVCDRFRKGTPIDQALADSMEGFDITPNGAARITNASVKALKASGDWKRANKTKSVDNDE